MAATDPRSQALRALTAAALALPGLMPSAGHAAEGDEFSFEYHHYEEGERDLDGQRYSDLKLKPLQADSLALGMRGSITDRVKFGLDYTQDTWSGATPVTTVPHAAIADQLFSGASSPTSYSTDRHHHPVAVNWNTFNGTTVQFVPDAKLVHVMASASPETRRQVDSKIGYEWDGAALNFGGGISQEPDYRSYFANMDGRWDFNQKLTTLSWGGSYTISHIEASLEANSAADWGAYENKIGFKGGVSTLFGNRSDAAANIGITQILDKDSLISGSISYTRSAGYLSNPYKATVLAFDDPDQFIDSTGLRTVVLKGALEERPRHRNQWTLDTRYVQYLGDSDAALHVDYRFYHDDWSINAHTLDVSLYQPLGDGWMAVPGVRYYTQTAAFFYQPYFLFNEAFPIKFPRNPELPPQLDFSKIPIHAFSSDERLSGFGTLTAQLAIQKQILDNIRLEVGAEYSSHDGSLKLGGGGEQSFANFNAYTFYASLNVDLAGRNGPDPRSSGAPPSTDDDADVDPRSAVPAGVQFTHLLDKTGDFALSLRHAYGIAGGDTLHGSHRVPDSAVASLDCGGFGCSRKVDGSYSHVTSLDLLYAPFDGWTLMVTPQFVDLHMDDGNVGGGFPPPPFLGPGSSGPGYRHSTGGFGDTGITALTELTSGDGYQLDAGIGLSVPTGSVNKRVNTARDYLSYGLQTGSGTWDFHPSLTYLGQLGRFSWGAQVSAVARLQSQNDSGYGLGDMAQATLWGSYNIFDGLSASVRGLATAQDSIKGQFKPHVTPVQIGYKVVHGEPVPIYEYDVAPQTEYGPMDQPGNYGGRFADVGFGLNFVIPGGAFAGDRVSLEWLQPVSDDPKGYQLKRTGTLAFSWDFQF